VKPRKKPMKTPHKHAKLIHAWAEGAEIEECDNEDEEWTLARLPDWLTTEKYRIKLTPKPDVLKYVVVHTGGAGILSKCQCKFDNLKLTFDGETGDLKSAEVI
jgi:hypothetical protein